MRKIGFVLGIIAAVLLLAVAAVWVVANPNRHRDAIQAQLERQFGRKFTLGEMSLGLFPFRFQVETPAIGDDESLNRQQPFLRAEKLDLRLSLLPMLRGSIEIESLELMRPSIELIRSKQGVWNFSTLGSKTPATSGAANAASGSSSTSLRLAKLVIRDGQLGITDLQSGPARSGYDHIDLSLLDYAPGKPFKFDVAAHIQGKDAQEIRLQGEGGPAAGKPADTPFHGDLVLKNVELESLLKFLDAPAALSANGVLSGESKIAARAGSITANGSLNLERARVNGLDIGYPIKADYNLTTQTAASLVTIEDTKVQLGRTPLSVAGTLNLAGNQAVMDLKVKSGDVSIAEIARLASAFGVAFAQGTSVDGRVRADLRVKGPATKPELSGTIAGRDLQISGQGMPQAVQVQAVDVTLSPTAIRSNEFNATSGKTTVVGQLSLLQYASSSPSIDVGLRAPSATLPEIQAIAKAYGLTGLEQLSGDGSLNFDFRAKGPLQSLNAVSAIKTLNGTLNLDFSPLHIAGFDPGREFGRLGSFASSLSDEISMDIVRITGHLLVKEGVAQTDDLNAQLNVGSMAATGTADLAAETLNLRTSTVFSKEFSDKIRSNRRANIMTIALTNNAGEIVLPAFVSGTFKQPKISPDLQTLAQLQRQRLLPTLANPRGALGNVLDVFTGKQQPAAETPPEQTGEPPANKRRSVVNGILDALGRKKAQDQNK